MWVLDEPLARARLGSGVSASGLGLSTLLTDDAKRRERVPSEWAASLHVIIGTGSGP